MFKCLTRYERIIFCCWVSCTVSCVPWSSGFVDSLDYSKQCSSNTSRWPQPRTRNTEIISKCNQNQQVLKTQGLRLQQTMQTMNVTVKTNKVMFDLYHEDHESHVDHDFHESHVVHVDHMQTSRALHFLISYLLESDINILLGSDALLTQAVLPSERDSLSSGEGVLTSEHGTSMIIYIGW